MGRDDSRIARVLGELADLGRRIGERAEELATLAGPGRAGEPTSGTADTAEMAASAAQLAASAAGLAAAKPEPARRPPVAAEPVAPLVRRGRQREGAAGRRVRPKTAADGGSPERSVKARSETHRRARRAGPVLVSTAMHVVVIMGLAMIFVARDAKPERFVITSDAPAEVVVDEFSPVEFEVSESVAEESAEPAAAELVSFEADPVAIDTMAFSADLAAADAPDIPPTSFDSADMLAAVGGGTGAEAGGGRAGGSKGEGTAGAPTFFGRKGQGQTVCFVCDNSNSYRDGGFHMVLAEVARAVDALQPSQSFFVLFFSDAAYPMWQPDRLDAVQPATRENKQRLQTWLGTVEMCAGGQGIHDAVKLAAGLGVEVIYFLSDGEHEASVVERVAKADLGDTVVHTFGIQQNVIDKRSGAMDPERIREQQSFNQNLIDIATAHGGTFTPVIVPPQAAALEQHRPIRKNRSRGPVWGLKL